jgi:hypothetical protein
MPVDQNWYLLLCFDFDPDALKCPTHDLIDVFRECLSPDWAVSLRPVGIVAHWAPHVAVMTFSSLTCDPVEIATDMISLINKQVENCDVGQTMVFSGLTIEPRPVSNVSWAPSVRGTARVA